MPPAMRWREILIVTSDAEDSAYTQSLTAAAEVRVRAILADAVPEVLAGLGATDDVLVFDVHRWPIGDVAVREHFEAYLQDHMPTQLIATGAEQRAGSGTGGNRSCGPCYTGTTYLS